MNKILEIFKKYFIILICGMTIAPLIVLSFCAHPSAGDDYFYTNAVLEHGFWEAQKKMYYDWQGRFFATAIGSLNPLVFGWIFGYKLLPIILIFLLLHSSYLLTSEAAKRSLPAKTVWALALALFFLYVFNMPSLCEGIYWMIGTLTYQTPNIFTAYFFALLLRIYRTEEFYKRLFVGFAASFFLIATIGSNETSMLILLVALGSIFAYRLLFTKKIDTVLVLLLGVAIIASGMVIFAPGNTARATLAGHQPDLIQAVTVAFFGSFSMMAQWVSAPLILLTMMFIPVGLQISNHFKKSENHFAIHPLVSAGILLIVTFTTFFPAAWARGNLGPPRVLNVGYFIFLLNWLFNIQMIIHHFNKGEFKFEKLAGRLYPILGLAVLGCIFLQHNNIRLAYSNLVSARMVNAILSLHPRKSDLQGTAFFYDIRMSKRYAALQQCEENVCEVKSMKSFPYAIFFEDIQEDAQDWRNRTVATYFNKKAVKLKIKPNGAPPKKE